MPKLTPSMSPVGPIAPLLIALALLAPPAGAEPGVLAQISTIDALLAGVYDGPTRIAKLRALGDFGLGTVNGLDGELVAVDGRFYRVTADGLPRPLADDDLTPFAVVTTFELKEHMVVPAAIDFVGLERVLDRRLPSPNLFYAVRIEGHFKHMKTRSPQRQTPPYRPLAEALKTQSVFDLDDIEGVMVAFRCPPYVKGINVPGYHAHFLSADRKHGGHVLDFQVDQATLAWSELTELRLLLPTDAAFEASNLGGDKSQELQQAERPEH